MANLDWLRGDEFHSEIRREIERMEKELDVDFSDYGSDYLIELFDENKRLNYLTESRKPSTQQKSLREAKESVRTLLKAAVKYAREERKSDFVTRDDLKEAYRIHYCGVWPLCGGR